MKKTSTTCACSALLLWACAFVLDAPAPASAALVNQYFPMHDGDTRNYQLHFIPSWTATETFHLTSLNGSSVFTVNCNSELTGPAQGVAFLAYSGSALTIYGISNSYGTLFFNPRVILFDEQSLANGGTRSVSTQTSWAGQPIDVRITTTISTVDQMTVPLGTYRNCKRVQTSFDFTYMNLNMLHDSFQWVLAPYVGIIADFAPVSAIQDDYLELVSGWIFGTNIVSSCVYNLGESSVNLGGIGTNRCFSVTTSANCSWTALASSSWIHTSSSGTGNGMVCYTVDANSSANIRTGTISVGNQVFTITQGPAGYVWHPVFGWLYDGGGNWYYHNGFDWMWFSSGPWIWSESLQGWIATMGNSPPLWSPQFRWLSPTNDAYHAKASTLGTVHLNNYHGTAINKGWVVSDCFGFVWSAGDGVWFYSSKYGWLGVTPEGGIWCVPCNGWLAPCQ